MPDEFVVGVFITEDRPSKLRRKQFRAAEDLKEHTHTWALFGNTWYLFHITKIVTGKLSNEFGAEISAVSLAEKFPMIPNLFPVLYFESIFRLWVMPKIFY